MKKWPLRSRVAFWAAVLLTVVLIIFGAASGWVIYEEQLVEDEIGRLVRVLNETLDRLERSFAQAMRFSSDASHELKTPLTIMRGEIESALRAEVNNPWLESRLDNRTRNS